MLFTVHPVLDRFEHAAKSGFKAVEFLFPYAFKAQNIRQRLDAFDLTLGLHSMEGEFAATRQKALPRTSYIQLADNPGRN